MTDKFIKFISTDETEVPITVSSDGKTDPSGNPSFAFPGGGGGGGAPGFYTITYASTIDWDCSSGSARVVLEGDPDIANPTNLAAGETYFLSLVQDGTGNRAVNSWGTSFKFPSNVKWDLSVIHDREDIILFVSDGTYLYPIAIQKNVANTDTGDITFENYTQYYNSSSEDSSTWSMEIGSNSGRVLLVCCEYRNGAGATDITYNGVSLVQRERIATGDVCSEIWALEEASLPTTGVYDIVVSSNSSDVFSFCASLWYNVSAIGSTTGNSTNYGTYSEIDILADNGNVVVDCLAFQSTNSSETPGTGQTVIDAFTSNAAALAVSYKVLAQSTTAMTWFFGLDSFSHCAIVLQ
jgi:hypothetical protein